MRVPLRARLGLRLKLTLVVAGAMTLLFGALGLFVYLRFESHLDRSLAASLRSRAADVRALVLQADSGLSQAGRYSLVGPGERFAQIITGHGAVLDATPGLPRTVLLSPAELRRGSAGPTLIERARVPGAAGSSRLLATPVRAQDQRLIVVVGSSLREHDGALADLRTVLLLGGPVALLLASLLGNGVARMALRSVDSMRSRAQQLSIAEPGGRLPVPSTGDELARLALTLNEMLARNEAAFQRERTFVADASHELRSPLAILKAELDVALVGESSQAELEHAVRSAGEEADRLAALAEDLLLLAESDRASMPLERRPIEVATTLRRLSERFAQRAAAAGAVIRAEAPGDVRMQADPVRLEQALGNLLDNALRYGAHRIALEAERRGDAVELRVSDDGPGFPPDFMWEAFERFTRADRTRTKGGAGLGLAIVRSIAHAHGGEAHIARGPEGGACVWLSIPDAATDERASSTAVPANSAAG